MKSSIVVIGMGYVGIPCAALLADVEGFQVTGVQRRSLRSGWKIDCLNSGNSPFKEQDPELSKLIRRIVEKGSFHVTDDFSVCAHADVIMVDVQIAENGRHISQDDSFCEVIAKIGEFLRKDALVIIESAVAPGTTENVVKPALERASGLHAGDDFYLAFSYGRGMPGRSLRHSVRLPRVVGGISKRSTELAVELYSHIMTAPITPTDCLTAEAAKAIENCYLDVNIAFANEAAFACEKLGVDVFRLRDLVNARPDTHMYPPGAGVGGQCLPMAPWLLKYSLDRLGKAGPPLKLIPMAREINDEMPHHMVELIVKNLLGAGRPLHGARITVLGVACLEDSADTRDTPALPLIQELTQMRATVLGHDPYVSEQKWHDLVGHLGIPLVRDLRQALEGSDCAAIVTKHRAYVDFDWSAARHLMRTPIIIDGRNVLDGVWCVNQGMTYSAVGKASATAHA